MKHIVNLMRCPHVMMPSTKDLMHLTFETCVTCMTFGPFDTIETLGPLSRGSFHASFWCQLV